MSAAAPHDGAPADAPPPATQPSQARRLVAATSIFASSLTAGSIFCFPLFAPNLTRDLGLTLTQTNTVWAGAVVGEYFSAAPWGALADHRGPRPLCLAAAALFGLGYALMASADRDALRLGTATPGAAALMTGYFLLVGAGVAASFFASLTSAAAYFPSHPSLALSLPSTVFSLSSLFLTQLAALPTFTDVDTGDLDAAHFLAFLGAMLAVVNVLGAFAMGGAPRRKDAPVPEAAAASDEERAPLLRSGTAETQAVGALPYLGAEHHNLGGYVKSPGFLLMCLLVFSSAGGAEMLMSSVGSIVVSIMSMHTLDGPSDPELGREELRVRARLVGIIAITNTIARLLSGLLTDLLCPSRPLSAFARSASSSWHGKALRAAARVRISRVTFVMGAQVLLLAAFAYAATAMRSISGLAVVCALTGLGYGMVFTVVPSTILIAWGPSRFGRNWGTMTYAAAAGSLGFSLLFAAVSDSVAAQQGASTGAASGETVGGALCTSGAACYQPSFAIAAIAGVAALGALWPLWRAWRTRL